MRRTTAIVAVIGLLAAACSGDSATTTSEAVATSSVASTSTTAAETTTTAASSSTTLGQPGFPDVVLPVDSACSLDDAPELGEPTVVVDGRLYGLGEDWVSPRCLLEGVATTDLDWGPEADRIRVGDSVATAGGSIPLPAADEYVWTAPTGSRILAVISDRLWKIDLGGGDEIDITFLADTDTAAYHPAGEHVLAIGTTADAQYGLWLATNEGSEALLLAFDELATMSEPTWTWLGEPLFIARHIDGPWHVHRVELSAEGSLEGPIIVETDMSLDMLTPSPFDPVMLAYRSGGEAGQACVEGARVSVSGVDLPEPVASMTSSPVGWLSTERLLLVTYPEGCDGPADLWSFSAGFCPGSVYGVTPVISGVDGAAARQAVPAPPPPPDFTGIIDPGPA